MDSKMRVLLAAAEAYPFAKVGGLADIAGSLPKALAKLDIDCRIIIPLYDKIGRDFFSLNPENIQVSIEMGYQRVQANLWSGKFPGTSIKAYFVECEKYFGRPGIYTDPETGEAYPDDGERYIFFSKAVVAMVKEMNWKPDILHCNDYQTGLIPAIMKLNHSDEDCGLIYSIHNLAYQGRYDSAILDYIGFGRDQFYPMGPFEFFGQVNLMKIGINFTDIINTVSPTYSREIQSSEEYGYGLEGILKSKKDNLYGVLNGIDTTVWNPEIDEHTPYKFTRDDLSGKRMCKAALLKEVGLPDKELDKPIISMISRLADQKGFDILLPVLEDIINHDCYFVVLGTGKKAYEAALTKMAKKYPRNMAAVIDFKGPLAHRIEAGADMFLMPSKYEPCGLNQMYSMTYGTVPIVRKTGGLNDTVEQADLENEKGTGFVFEKYDSKALYNIVSKALKAFENGQGWRKLQSRGMKKDFSWKASAGEYVKLYRQALAMKKYND